MPDVPLAPSDQRRSLRSSRPVSPVVPPVFFTDYIFFIGGLFGHYGSSDVTVMLALVRLFRTCVEVLPADSDRLDVLDQAAAAALADAERSIPRPTDLERIRRGITFVLSKINLQRQP
jgi:uncharacterized membrane protein